MPVDVVLVAEKRPERGTRPAGRLRRDGLVPAVVYGLGTDTLSVTVPARQLGHILAGGVNTLITLKLDGGDQLALARQIQRHPTRGDVLHVDFVRVRTDVAVSAEVPLILLGEPAGVKDGGRLEQLVFSLPIEAMPQSIPTELEVDVTALELAGQLRVGEIRLPDGVTAMLEPDALVAQVAVPRGLGEGEVEEGLEGEAEAGGEAAAAPTAEEAGGE